MPHRNSKDEVHKKSILLTSWLLKPRSSLTPTSSADTPTTSATAIQSSTTAIQSSTTAMQSSAIKIPTQSATAIPSVLHSLPKDIFGAELKQPRLKSYPRDKDNRCFRSQWFDQFPWLEYSVERDAAYCHPCRIYATRSSKEFESVFIKAGYRAWKTALGDKRKGFVQHAETTTHRNSTIAWNEQKNREDSRTSISYLLNSDILEKRRYYVQSLIEIVQFLATNELPFRGDDSDSGVFIKMFKYTLRKDKKLADIEPGIPRNSTYTSPTIQNDLIDTLANVVARGVASDCLNADVPFFTLLADGTRDKSNIENISISVRFVKNGKVEECLLCMPMSAKLDASSMTDVILESLAKYNLPMERLLTQCYDGASSMSGRLAGVQAIIQRRAGKEVPYVHCFNHRLHLVIVDLVSTISAVRYYFDQCAVIYKFFKCQSIVDMYNGTKLKPLLETRWSGHHDATKRLIDNHAEIVSTLKEISKSMNLEGDLPSRAIGLRKILCRPNFMFIAVVMKRILGILMPIDKALQSHACDLRKAMELISQVKEMLNEMRSEEVFSDILTESNAFIKDQKSDHPSRKRKISTLLRDSVVLAAVSGHQSDIDSINTKAVYFEIIDLVTQELYRRFEEKDWLYKALQGTIPDGDEFLIKTTIDPLSRLGITIPDEGELDLVRRYLKKKIDGRPTSTLLDVLHNQREAFQCTYDLFAAVSTMACSTAVCEASFSALTRIDRPQRRSMAQSRRASLCFLTFEKDRVENIDVQSVLKTFSNVHKRLQLF